MLPNLNDLIETFDLLPDWEARYAYLIDLGRALPPMDLALKVDDVLVPGCTSRVWLVVEEEERECHPGRPQGDPGPSDVMADQGPGSSRCAARDDNSTFHFHIDSDAAIVKGLCAVLMVMVQDKTRADIMAVDIEAVFGQLRLADHLSPNRRNGFFAMVERVKKITD